MHIKLFTVRHYRIIANSKVMNLVGTNGHVKSTVFKFTVFLAQGTGFTAAMNQEIPTWTLLQHVLSPHLAAVEA